MKNYFLVLIFFSFSLFSFSQSKQATTTDGKTVTLYPDGTWKYSSGEVLKVTPCNSQKGDYCFKNNTEYELQIESDYDQHEPVKLSLTIAAGQTECVYDIPAGVIKLRYWYMVHASRMPDNTTQIRVESCAKNPPPKIFK